MRSILTLLLCFVISATGFAQLNLPVDFESDPATYNLIDFGGNSSQIVADPVDASNHVVQTLKTLSAELWAGTTVGGTVGFASNLPFAPGSTSMSVRVYSPAAGIPVRLKVEAANNPTISVETEATTTLANAWETLVFDFSNQAPGTAAINFANGYNKASIFFNFGTTGAQSGEQTYYWDDMQFVAGPPPTTVELPVTFENLTLNYDLIDFGGNASQIIVDPSNANNHIVQTIKTGAAELWAGTTIAGTTGFTIPVPFAAGSTTMHVRVLSPLSGIPVRLKAENSLNPGISVETDAMTTSGGSWETLEFNFANQVPGTAALNFANTYNKVSIFFYFGTTGAQSGEQTYYWDDVEFIINPPVTTVDLPVTFESPTINYNLIDFGGNSSVIMVDPTDAANHVVMTIKTGGAELWAGTTIGGTSGFPNPVPFAAGATTMSVRVYAPAVGMPVLLKAENAANGAISVETQMLTTVANAWETLVFNFANQAPGTPALNLANTYNKVSIFFNFGTPGWVSGALTFYWDDVEFVSGPPAPVVELPVTFEDLSLDYQLIDFGGTASSLVADPVNPANRVAMTIRPATAEFWAGTIVGGNIGFPEPIPFAPGMTYMTVRVYAPTFGIPVRFKVENSANGAISVETETVTTVAQGWQTLVFNFSNQAAGTAALDFNQSYNKAVLFFNFGTPGPQAGEQTYYWDDIQFIGAAPVQALSGSIHYNNAIGSVIANATVTLKQNGVVVAQTTAGSDGTYSFNGLAAGSYQMVVSSTNPWGGANSVDALLILKHFVGYSLLTGLPLKAAEVSNDNYINSLDGLFIVKRFVGMTNSFPVGDWVFETPTVVLDGITPLVQNIKGLCKGDVNGSFNP